MSKVIMPLLSQDARGSFSGIQFSRSRSGNFGSRKSTSTRAQGDRCINFRSQIKHAHTAWIALSDSLKLAWDSYAPPTQTGRNAFVGAALRNLAAGQSPPADDPLTHLPARPKELLKSTWLPFPADYLDITWHPALDTGNYMMAHTAYSHVYNTPHIRKFRYAAISASSSGALRVYPPDLHNPLALRLIYFDPLHGHTHWSQIFVYDYTQPQDWGPRFP